MKRRRNLLLVLLLISALSIGVGYAAVTGALTVNGTATTNRQNFSLLYKSWAPGAGTTPSVTPDVTNDIVGTNSATVTVTGLSKQNDTAVLEFTVENGHDFTMYPTTIESNLPAGVVANPGEHFTIEAEWIENNGSPTTTPAIQAAGIAEGEQAKFRVTITLTSVPEELLGGADTASVNQSFEIRLNATSTAP